MSRARRSVFTAPLVIVVATSGCGSKGEQPAAGSGSGSGSMAGSGSGSGPAANRIAWTIDRASGEECLARQDDCPPGKDCNPPPPLRFRCPPGAPAADTFTITTTAAGDTCYLGMSMTVVPCPYAAPLPPPAIDAGTEVATTEPHHRRWAVLRQGNACQAAEDTCQLRGAPDQPAPPCNPPPPTKLAACPPPDITAIVERAPGDCVQVHEPTLGPVGTAVPCPP